MSETFDKLKALLQEKGALTNEDIEKMVAEHGAMSDEEQAALAAEQHAMSRKSDDTVTMEQYLEASQVLDNEPEDSEAYKKALAIVEKFESGG
ncbi:MAG: hypothetical protein D6737_08455 [Chloroflexi bacterium]|nr:MAG: hypothetical protein D6737_08455 [Chloroflexota bacterium]